MRIVVNTKTKSVAFSTEDARKNYPKNTELQMAIEDVAVRMERVIDLIYKEHSKTNEGRI